MMKLLLDIGNTNAKYVFYQDGQMSDVTCLPITSLSVNYCQQQFRNCAHILLADVSAVATSILIEFATKYSKGLQIIQSESAKFGVTCGYANAQQLGVDRWLTMLAAKFRFPKQNCLIVDSGTATTIDLLDGKGTHHGGWIMPGLDMMSNAFSTVTAKVVVNTQQISELEFGHDTASNVNQGVVVATIGAIEQAITLAVKMGIAIDKIVLTGGKSEQLAKLLAPSCAVIDTLIFDGLALYCAE
jgi:type III pantothenate kinase